MSAREGLAAVLADEIARHKPVAHLVGDDPKQNGVIRDGGYRCACGAVYGVREFVPTGRRRERDPRPSGPTKEDHLADVILRDWLPGALVDERVVEAATKSLGYMHRVVAHSYATAALTAAVTALREEGR